MQLTHICTSISREKLKASDYLADTIDLIDCTPAVNESPEQYYLPAVELLGKMYCK